MQRSSRSGFGGPGTHWSVVLLGLLPLLLAAFALVLQARACVGLLAAPPRGSRAARARSFAAPRKFKTLSCRRGTAARTAGGSGAERSCTHLGIVWRVAELGAATQGAGTAFQTGKSNGNPNDLNPDGTWKQA